MYFAVWIIIPKKAFLFLLFFAFSFLQIKFNSITMHGSLFETRYCALATEIVSTLSIPMFKKVLGSGVLSPPSILKTLRELSPQVSLYFLVVYLLFCLLLP